MKRRQQRPSKHSYSSDRPIGSKKEDVLKRAHFAERLAEDLQSWDGSDSLVVALYGTWGSGKTSVKNMLLESIQRGHGAMLPVMEFNPWQLSGSGDIPASFFRELGIARFNALISFLTRFSGLIRVSYSPIYVAGRLTGTSNPIVRRSFVQQK